MCVKERSKAYAGFARAGTGFPKILDFDPRFHPKSCSIFFPSRILGLKSCSRSSKNWKTEILFLLEKFSSVRKDWRKSSLDFFLLRTSLRLKITYFERSSWLEFRDMGWDYINILYLFLKNESRQSSVFVLPCLAKFYKLLLECSWFVRVRTSLSPNKSGMVLLTHVGIWDLRLQSQESKYTTLINSAQQLAFHFTNSLCLNCWYETYKTNWLNDRNNYSFWGVSFFHG